ncbi:tyrosine-type recombinase/integrase [Mycolicibacterium arenosum]|uniref:Tyrosine-type recombinase/integrase n=1 Tax=Mycolicibacterium arenosum TaxID=2952157 RepID=A0ABT1MAX7_9MYCO|nr:tyrosine-type recombinase/integrase [Mycolicibacterium sp. CAU 1645]MCP9276333.1 tyrosine-type recombinase/integrase [Mycolicibacterium sp. CAU 1645]
MEDVPGSAHLVLASGVVHLDEPGAVFEAMLAGWGRQQKSRLLADSTVAARLALVRRFAAFAQAHPWDWTAADIEDFTASLMSGEDRCGPSTIRGYHVTLRMFCDYLLDGRYGWIAQCERRFDRIPSQVCHDFNTAAHLVDYEGRPARRPLSYDEMQTLFACLDDRVEVIARSGRKGALAALRDAQMVKTAYAFGLRRRELCFLDVTDLRPNPKMPQWGTFGAIHVRYAKSSRGSTPRRRTVLAVPEFDWVIDGLRQWVLEARPLLGPGPRPELWLTERRVRVSLRLMDRRFAFLRAEAGLAPELALHCLRHSYVTHLIEFGYPERFVTEQVGHSYASTTAIYTSVSNDFKTRTLQAALRRVYGTTTESEKR